MSECSNSVSLRFEKESDIKLFNDNNAKFKVICPVCGSEYHSIHQVRMHLRSSSSQPFSCGICGKGLNCDFNLNCHLKKHNCEKPYVCEVCDKGFHIFSALKVHIKEHLGNKPYRCNLCEEQFIVSSDLKEHLMNHIGRKPYDFMCVCCGCAFTRHSAFCRHKKWCDIKFKKEFICRSQYAEKPFVCEVCHISFQSFKIFKMHLEKHLGAKPFECNLCNEQFSSMSNLKQHLISHINHQISDSE